MHVRFQPLSLLKHMNILARTVKLRSLTAALIGSLILAGCASTGSSFLQDASVAADPRLTKSSDAEFFSKSGYQACAAGALTGVLGCTLSNSSNKALCAVAAGIATCGVAMGANYYLDQRRSEYANSAERLKVMSNDVREDTKKVQERTQTALQVIADDKKSLARIQTDMKRQALDKTAAQKDLGRIDKNIAVLRKDLDNMNDKVAQYREVSDAESSAGNKKQAAQLDAEIKKMNSQVASLQGEVDMLFEQRSAITLG